MKRVHTAATIADAYMVRDVLLAEGIDATIRNEHLIGASGEVPVPETWPTIEVEEAAEDRARAILSDYRTEDGHHALDAMDAGAATGADGPEAHLAMSELFVAAGRLMRSPDQGDAVDDLQRHATFVTTTAAPFGVSAEGWQNMGALAEATVQAVANGAPEDDVRDRAAQLRSAVAPFV